ncbi:MAG: 50S ribosomal protein L19 [Candidatus Nealsonbacteria bacterium]|nr:50S ribosomal protein L19 [Candidatus Nealsonbacteria bacterium]
MNKVKKFTEGQLRNDLPEIRIGDTIKLHYKFTEKGKERVQPFEAVVIAKRGEGISTNMTLRGPAAGVMMEKIIPMNSPNITKIEIIKRSKVRRSKLYYLREVFGKRAKLKKKEEAPKDKVEEVTEEK